MGSRSKKNRKLIEKSSAELITEHNEPIPFVNENGDIKNRAIGGGIQMNYCPNCEALQPNTLAGYCGLCGKHGMTQKVITMRELKKNSRKKGIHWIKPKGYKD